MILVEYRKNGKETVRIEVKSYKGNTFVDLRVYQRQFIGDAVPTSKGIAIKADNIEEVIGALTEAHHILACTAQEAA